MPSYIAMLRGINVAGSKPLKMDALKDSLEELKFDNIQTYIQSGNIVFETKKIATDTLAAQIAKNISKNFKYDLPVVVRTKEEIQKIVKANPFLKNKKVQVDKLHVTFLSAKPAAAAITKLKAISSGKDESEVIGREVFLHCPDGYGRTKLSNTALEKTLAVEATTRNWKTVNVLLEMAS